MINRAIFCLLAFYTFVCLPLLFNLLYALVFLFLFTKNSIHGRFKKAFFFFQQVRVTFAIFFCCFISALFLNFLVRLVKISFFFWFGFQSLQTAAAAASAACALYSNRKRILLYPKTIALARACVCEKTGKNLRSLLTLSLSRYGSREPIVLSSLSLSFAYLCALKVV